MNDRNDLEGKLAAASEWVRDEFGFIADLAGELGCEMRPESGPGLAFRVRDRVIARAHPKGTHIGVGLPDWMRPDVQALTGALRDQRGFAWFNYAPGIADRDTVELLVAVSRDAIEAPGPTDAMPGTGRAQPARRSHTRANRDDDADLALVLAILQAYKRHADATGFTSAVKPIREAIFFQWEAQGCRPGASTPCSSLTHLRHGSARCGATRRPRLRARCSDLTGRPRPARPAPHQHCRPAD